MCLVVFKGRVCYDHAHRREKLALGSSVLIVNIAQQEKVKVLPASHIYGEDL